MPHAYTEDQNLGAADVSPLHLSPGKIGADSRQLLSFHGSVGATLTIQPRPKRSVSMPKRGDQNVLARGI